MLISAGIGLLLGSLLTAAFLPLLTSSSSHHHPVVLPTPIPYSATNVRAKVASLSGTVLGYVPLGPNEGQQRLRNVSISQVVAGPTYGVLPHILYDVRITFLLNPNTIVPSVQVGEAKTDSFLLLQALYSHNLPLRTVELFGVVPHDSGYRVMLHAGSNPLIELQLSPWNDARHDLSPTVWRHLRPNWISPAFATYRP